jgi:hypothetical protein
MKSTSMMKSRRYIKILALAAAAAIFHVSLVWAVPLETGSLAVLEPSIPDTRMRAAWEGIRKSIFLDPLLLTMGREEVVKGLNDWQFAADSVRLSLVTSDRITLERTRLLIDQAWSHYYQFEYKQASAALEESRKLLLSPGDSGFRARLMFELLLLKGIVARSAGDDAYRNWFAEAAAIDPGGELSPEKYSPEIISTYSRFRDELIAGGTVPVSVAGTPTDASVKFSGVELDKADREKGYQVLPGIHFLEVKAPGYEPWSKVLETRRFQPSTVRYELVPNGPEADTENFFLGRLKAGDGVFLALLAGKLDVDYLLVPDPQADNLGAWLVDSNGEVVDNALLWKPGDDKDTGSLRAAGLLKPLRQELTLISTTPGAPLSLPAAAQPLSEEGTDSRKSSLWSRYAVPLGILLLIGAAVSGSQGGDTRIEATW